MTKKPPARSTGSRARQGHRLRLADDDRRFFRSTLLDHPASRRERLFMPHSRPSRRRKQATALDVRDLRRRGFLRPGRQLSCSVRVGGEPSGARRRRRPGRCAAACLRVASSQGLEASAARAPMGPWAACRWGPRESAGPSVAFAYQATLISRCSRSGNRRYVAFAFWRRSYVVGVCSASLSRIAALPIV